MKKITTRVLLIFWLIIVFVISAVYFAPANLMSFVLSHYTKSTFQILAPQGKFWQGRGELISLLPPTNTPRQIAPIKWDLQLSQIWRGKLAFNILIGADKSTIIWQNGWDLNIKKLPLPLKLIDNFLPPDILITWQDLKASGEVVVEELVGKIDSRGRSPNLKARLFWSQAGVSIFPINPIGDYQVNIDLLPQNAKLNISTRQGPLNISGSGDSDFRKLNLTLNFRPNQESRSIIEPILRFWGESNNNGESYQLILREIGQ